MTGAAGLIGRSITPALAARWDLRLTDLRADGSVAALDITDLSACREAFAGVDAVVHLAADPDPEAAWEQLLPANVVGTHNVARAAMDRGVRRLVLASSLHTMSAAPDGVQARAQDAPRPANLYGATKAWSEAIGSWVAATSTTSVVALRIGYFAVDPPDHDVMAAREVSAWLSARDAAELVRAAVEAEGVHFVVANGTSANRYRRADLDEAVRLLGYRPADDAWPPR